MLLLTISSDTFAADPKGTEKPESNKHAAYFGYIVFQSCEKLCNQTVFELRILEVRNSQRDKVSIGAIFRGRLLCGSLQWRAYRTLLKRDDVKYTLHKQVRKKCCPTVSEANLSYVVHTAQH